LLRLGINFVRVRLLLGRSGWKFAQLIGL
jgi:hypothetical protein